MSLAFYMNEHVPRSITSGLRLRTIDVLTVQEDGKTGFPDRKILDRATELNRILFTLFSPNSFSWVNLMTLLLTDTK